MNYKRYFVKEANKMEMVECKTCGGTGKIVGTLTSDALEAPIENTDISCPICHGSGKVTTGKRINFEVGTIVVYGNAMVSDGEESGEYTLGFVCDDDDKIKQFKDANHIDNFVSYPNALSFYMNREDVKMYETYEEAMKEVEEKEAALLLEEKKETDKPKFEVVKPDNGETEK